MSAEVIAYSANSWDLSLTLKVECLKCRIEWGWSDYSDSIHKHLQMLADQHNGEHHTKTD